MHEIKIATLFLVSFSTAVFAESAQRYVTPPTSSTMGYVPTISDEAMEECVRIYNEARWLSDKIDSTFVDNYNQASVNAYNNLVSKHQNLTRGFNAQCAGKTSYSACRAAQKLNEEAGLPHQECIVGN